MSQRKSFLQNSKTVICSHISQFKILQNTFYDIRRRSDQNAILKTSPNNSEFLIEKNTSSSECLRVGLGFFRLIL
jgi:hypothetical protein